MHVCRYIYIILFSLVLRAGFWWAVIMPECTLACVCDVALPLPFPTWANIDEEHPQRNWYLGVIFFTTLHSLIQGSVHQRSEFAGVLLRWELPSCGIPLLMTGVSVEQYGVWLTSLSSEFPVRRICLLRRSAFSDLGFLIPIHYGLPPMKGTRIRVHCMNVRMSAYVSVWF